MKRARRTYKFRARDPVIRVKRHGEFYVASASTRSAVVRGMCRDKHRAIERARLITNGLTNLIGDTNHVK